MCVYCVCVCVCVCVTLSLLYHSFVAWIRSLKTVGAGSRMEALQKYVLARDAEPKAAVEPVLLHVLPRPGNCTVYSL